MKFLFLLYFTFHSSLVLSYFPNQKKDLRDIPREEASIFLRIEQLDEKRLKLERCSPYENYVTCELIGGRGFYFIDDLESERIWQEVKRWVKASGLLLSWLTVTLGVVLILPSIGYVMYALVALLTFFLGESLLEHLHVLNPDSSYKKRIALDFILNNTVPVTQDFLETQKVEIESTLHLLDEILRNYTDTNYRN